MEVKTQITVNLPGLQKYRNEIRRNRGRMQAVYSKWAIRYRAFIQRRFDNLSRGGGKWPPLKYRQGSILRDTNTLFTVLAPTLNPPAGSINKMLNDGVEVGYSGSASHPGGPTIPEIAFWHQTGAGNLPVREIIVEPDAATLRAMVADAEKALNE